MIAVINYSSELWRGLNPSPVSNRIDYQELRYDIKFLRAGENPAFLIWYSREDFFFVASA